MQSDHTPIPSIFEAEKYLNRIRKSFTTPGAPIYCTWDDGYSLGDTLTVNLTTRNFHIARAVYRAVKLLGGTVQSVVPECRVFWDLATDRLERHAVLSVWFELDGAE